jgi:hypothetical protein
VGGENRLKTEQARFLTDKVRRAKPETEPLLTDLWPSSRTQISESSKGVCFLGRRAGFSIPPDKGRQGVSMKLSSRRKGEVSSPSKLTWGRSGDIKQVFLREMKKMSALTYKKAGGNIGKAGVFIERMDCQ